MYTPVHIVFRVVRPFAQIPFFQITRGGTGFFVRFVLTVCGEVAHFVRGNTFSTSTAEREEREEKWLEKNTIGDLNSENSKWRACPIYSPGTSKFDIHLHLLHLCLKRGWKEFGGPR